MDNFTNFFTASVIEWGSTSILEIFLVLFGTFILSLFIAFVYKKTYNWKFYNQNFVHTIITLAVLIAMVMLTVGSSVAWAFTLMWVLSIIRFRNSLKDTRDLWFIFFGIAIWLAMWTQLYTFAIIWTFAVSGIFYIINKFSLFEWEQIYTQILKVYVSENTNFDDLLKNIFEKYTTFYELVWVESVFENKEVILTETEKKVLGIIWDELPATKFVLEKSNVLSYKIIHKKDLNISLFLKEVEKMTKNNKTFLTNITK